MTQPNIVSRQEWLQARKALLAKEKEFTVQRDQLNLERRELPWVHIDKSYVFDGPTGPQSLADLFENRSQLLIYHFMFGPDWKEGCKSCSFWMDNVNGTTVHLNHRDVTFTAISKAPLEKLQAYQKRMGWDFKWVSSLDNDFNRDFHVSFTPEEKEQQNMFYNYKSGFFPSTEAPGISVFYKDEAGKVFHTYSCYSRGLDMLNGAYHHLDLTPKGRDEDHLPNTMAWLQRHDSYEN